VGGYLPSQNSGSNDLSVFSVNQSSGALSQVSGSPFTTGTAPHTVVFSPDGKLLAIANNASNNVTVLSSTVVPTSRFTVSRIKSYPDGTISLLVRVPGAGSVDVVVTARDDNRAGVAALGRSKAHRIVFARSHSRARGAGTIRVRMKPTAAGKRLVHRHAHRVTLTVSVTYTPSAGGRRRIKVGGLHLPASH
jgi:DNA-binding beta-propeller fold protein YncE